MLKISIGSDHGGLDYKNAIISYLRKEGYDVFDVGTYTEESCHYPIFAFKAAELVSDHTVDLGILICTSGEGISIAANKVKGIRCAIGYNDEVSRLCREHNHANMIAFGQKFMTLEDVLRRVKIFLNTKPLGDRHSVRVKMIEDYEK